MADSIVVKAKIKDVAAGYNIAGDFAEALDTQTRKLIKSAVKRAEANNRKTVMAKDL
jgi:histone H3/H4